jgi:hypothetical protein
MTSRLADQLRALPDDGLGALLRLRPDLAVPVPADVSALASRIQGRASVARVLDGLDLFTLEILDGLRLVREAEGGASVPALLTLVAEAGVEPTDARAAIDRLRARFVVYGLADEALYLVHAVDELLSPYPAGLGRPAAELDEGVAELVADPAGLRRVVLSAPPEARAVLDRLAAGPPIGSVQTGLFTVAKGPTPARKAAAKKASAGASTTGMGHTTAETDSPVRWLVDHQLLVAIADDMVELPREIGILLRRDEGPLGALHPKPPAIEATARSGVDSAGAGQALEAVRHLEALLHALTEVPAMMLRTFGLGVRDLKRLARDTGLTEPVAALLLEIAYACGLLTYTEPAGAGGEQRWLPAPSYDTWRTSPLPARWARLARIWLAMTRTPAMVGLRDEKDRVITALSFEAARLGAPVARRSALSVLAGLRPDNALTAEDVLAQLSWQAPRRMGRGGSTSGPHSLARAALIEAAALGVTSLDALTSYGRLLLAEGARDPDEDPLGVRESAATDALITALGKLLPAPMEQVLVQADLTVVVPGPPEPELAAELTLVADAESRGGATVYRVTPESVRRALDTGYTADDVHKLFARRSRTALPQALRYLVDDVARRHGGLRIGSAGSYLRSDDAALVTEVLADRRLAPLGLRRLAPTVLASGYASTRVLELLRDAGYAPVAENATGAAVLTRPKALRAPLRPAPRGARPDDFDPPNLAGARLAGVVEQIRLGDKLARAARRSPLTKANDSAQAHTHVLLVLQQAMRDQTRVWVAYVDAHGGAASRLVRPVSIGAGYLRAEDDRTEMMHTFALHRITSAVLEDQV